MKYLLIILKDSHYYLQTLLFTYNQSHVGKLNMYIKDT